MADVKMIFIICILTYIFMLINMIDRYKNKSWISNFQKYSDYILFVLVPVVLIIAIVGLVR